MNSCVVRPHRAGLWSLINNVITCLAIHDHVHVDWSEGCPYGRKEEGNIWNVLFEPTQPPTGEHETISSYPDQWLTYKNAGLLYESGVAWRYKCNALWKILTIKPWILNNVQQFQNSFFNGKTVAVLVRAHGHSGEQLTNRSQELSEYASALERETPDTVYVACGDMETLAWFQARFDVVHHCGTHRAPDRSIDLHLVEPQTAMDASVCIEEVMLMSATDVLIHPISNMATGALYINPSLRSIYLK